VLAQSPVFARSSEMVPGYARYARAHLEDAPGKAADALRRVIRLSAEGDAVRKSAESLLLTLEAERLLHTHVADQTLLRRALELDPGNDRARTLLSRMSRGDADPDARAHRYLAAGVIGALALAALAFIGLRRGKVAEPGDPKPDPDPKADSDSDPEPRPESVPARLREPFSIAEPSPSDGAPVAPKPESPASPTNSQGPPTLTT